MSSPEGDGRKLKGSNSSIIWGVPKLKGPKFFQNPSKTLTDKVVNLEIKKIFMALKDKFNVELRDGELP